MEANKPSSPLLSRHVMAMCSHKKPWICARDELMRKAVLIAHVPTTQVKEMVTSQSASRKTNNAKRRPEPTIERRTH